MNDISNMSVETLAFELNMILFDYSNDSKASKRCFCNRAEPIMQRIVFELLKRERNANA